MAQFGYQPSMLSGDIPGDKLVRSARIVGCTRVEEGFEFRLQTTSGCTGCTCGWQKSGILHTSLLSTRERGGEPHPHERRNVAESIVLAVSRRGLSMVSGLVFGMPLLALVAAATLVEERLGDSLTSAVSLAVFLLSLWLVMVLARRQVFRFETWLRFEMTGLGNNLDNSMREGNE